MAEDQTTRAPRGTPEVSPEAAVPDSDNLGALEKIKRLKRRLIRWESDLLAQIDRWETSGGQAVAAVHESALANRVDEFQCEREAWELHRQQEIDRLQREGRMLAEAWQRLEAEKRSLLSERELLRRRAASIEPSPLSASTAPSMAQSASGRQRDAPRTGADDAAWLQFQQLRRQTQKHGGIA